MRSCKGTFPADLCKENREATICKRYYKILNSQDLGISVMKFIVFLIALIFFYFLYGLFEKFLPVIYLFHRHFSISNFLITITIDNQMYFFRNYLVADIFSSSTKVMVYITHTLTENQTVEHKKSFLT